MQTKMLVSRCWSASHLTMPGPVAMESHHALGLKLKQRNCPATFSIKKIGKDSPNKKQNKKCEAYCNGCNLGIYTHLNLCTECRPVSLMMLWH